MHVLSPSFAKVFGVLKTAMYDGVNKFLHGIKTVMPYSGGCLLRFRAASVSNLACATLIDKCVLFL